MELKLEVVLSCSIKRKKPWPRFCWLGLEKESVFLLDDKRISEVNMHSGQTKKKTPKLQTFLPRVVTMSASQNGVWLAGLLVSGEMFLWNRDRDLLKTVSAVPAVAQLISAAQASGVRLSLGVAEDGTRALLLSMTGQVFLWECVDVRELAGLRDGSAGGRWAQIQSPEHVSLPSLKDKETSQHILFIKGEAVGDVCLSAFVFTVGVELYVTFLKIQWQEGPKVIVNSSVGYRVQWVTKTYPLSHLNPPCRPVKSRGALVPAFSPEGLLLAIVLNQRDSRATQVLFVSTQNFVTVSSGLGACGNKNLNVPSRYVRSYWVASVSWAAGGLFLACVLKRGSILMLARLGALISLSTSGCNVDFGPAHFLPLHPLVTYRPPVYAGAAGVDPLSSSSASARDVLRQRYSVTWHPRLPYLIVSDGYMATLLWVPELRSPSNLLGSLLHHASQGLEKASRTLERTQPYARVWLESVSCLKLGSLQEPTPVSTPAYTPAAPSTLPLFLQERGGPGATMELVQRVQALFDDDSDLEGPPAGSHVEDGGRLEFASMFDTLHALSENPVDPDRSSPDPDAAPGKKSHALPPELRGVQGSLLTAWALGVSLGGAVEQRERLLRCVVRCVARFAALLRLTSFPSSHAGRRKKKSTITFSSRLLLLLRTLLSFLPWDGPHTGGRSCLGVVVELTQQLVGLLLSSPRDQTDSELSSQTLSTAVLLLQLTSHSLDQTYGLQQKPSVTDIYCVPFLHEEKGGVSEPVQQDISQQPSSRLQGVWREVYRQTLRRWEGAKYHGGAPDRQEERSRLSGILSQIQAALQQTGAALEDGPALLSYTGEEHFLLGSYSESAQVWRAELWAERERGGPRSVFAETRWCLSLLYGLLFRYCLKEAQGLGDHMARVLLYRAGPDEDNPRQNTDQADPVSWLPPDVHPEAACAVVQTLGRFMASYFTNQPLVILPPHSVDVLPPLHLPHPSGIRRLVPLCQEEVSGAVRGQQLSDVWTVAYAQDLLLQGGLLPEATWLSHRLGDWKTTASLGLAYTTYCTEHYDFTGLRWRELQLPACLEPERIFQSQLESLLGRKAVPDDNDKESYKSFTDSQEGEDTDLLQGSVQDILKASVMAGVDVLSQPLVALLDSAKHLASCFPALVPQGLYLPAPPLYCPQPAANTQDLSGVLGQQLEEASRHMVSGLLQRGLLLLRSARCSRPAAQWYISQLQRSQRLQHKIHQKYSQQQREANPFPEGLMKFANSRGFFRLGPRGDGTLDSVTIQTIICFRELCGLCWMLHVRDKLSMSCRKYQALRNRGNNAQVPAGEGEGTAAGEEALRWTCRFLPFSRFLNAEEILQDTLLSLVSELPSEPLVTESLVRSFPEGEESVRVPLREKYNQLLQRLGRCAVPVSRHNDQKREEEEEITIVLQERLRQRRKDLKRLARHLAPMELYLWEREEEEERLGGAQGAEAMLGRFHLGTSQSTSTLTDYGSPLLCSEGDTVENATDISEAFSSDLLSKPCHGGNKSVKLPDTADRPGQKDKQVGKSVHKEGQDQAGPAHGPPAGDSPCPALPVVGTWEFELEDEEFLRFLELFLSFVLEKDGPDPDSDCDPPLLKSFCRQLREKELHSLTFDVLTTLRRRQRDGHHMTRKPGGAETPVFRAGRCFKPDFVTTEEPAAMFLPSDLATPRTSGSASALSLPGLSTAKGSAQQGLFGVKIRATSSPRATPQRGPLGSEPSPDQSAIPWERPPERWALVSPASAEAVEIQRELDPRLEAQFPGLARLLEWMMRWADKRVLPGHKGRDRGREAARGGVEEGRGGAVIRVKVSAPAVLTALSMLERRYTTALLGKDQYTQHLQVPDRKWTVAPVLRPEVGWKMERESSVDTGYPGSADTPITAPEPDPQHSQLSDGSHTDGVEPETSQQSSSFNPHVTDFPDNQLKHYPEMEGDDSNCDEVSRSSASLVIHNTCIQIRRLRQTQSPHHQALTLADLQCSERNEESVDSNEDEDDSLLSHRPLSRISPDFAEERNGNGVVPGSTVSPQARPQPLPRGVAQDGARAADCSPNVAPPTDWVASMTRVPASAPEPTLPAQTDPVRQLLQDELFKLVQLQQVNFMSLMQVVGASFITLPQNNTLPPPPITVPSQSNALPVPRPTDPPPGRDGPTDQPPVQNMQPLAIHHGPSRDTQVVPGTLIPSSHGLLTTVEPTPPPFSLPVIPPPPGGASPHCAPHSSGLKLLQLDPLLSQGRPGHAGPVREAWASRSESRPGMTFPSHLNPSQYAPAAPKRAELRGWKVELDLNLAQSTPEYQPNRREQSNLHHPGAPFHHTGAPVEASRRAEPLHPHPGLPAHRPVHGLPLLRFHPDPRPQTSFSHAPLPLSSIPLTIFPVSVGNQHRLQLLHGDPELQRMVLPRSALPAPLSRLIPPEELTGWTGGRRRGEEPMLQLLRVAAQPQNHRAPATPPTSALPGKRGKRREERSRRADERSEVTFRPDDSIIPPAEPSNEVPGESAPGEGFAFPLGTFDSMLTGQVLVDRALSTAAELHAFAATHKRPPESHDACTNTDLAPPHSGGATFAEAAVTPVVPPELFVNLRFPRDTPVLDSENPGETERNLDAPGRQFINVTDLEDGALFQEVPSYPRLGALDQDTAPVLPSPPTSAQLHLLAASVTADTNPAGDPHQVRQGFSLTSSPSPAHLEPSGDPVTHRLLQGKGPGRPLEAKSPGAPRGTLSGSPGIQVTARLSEMDAQLAALQDIADHMEREFANTRLLVRTIDSITPVVFPDMLERRTLLNKTVTMAGSPPEEWKPRLSVHLDAEIREEEEQVEEGHHGQRWSPVRPETEQHVSHLSQDLTEDMKGTTGKLAEETLGLSGLSDVADILGDLMREGGISPTALGLSHTQAAHLNRDWDQQEIGRAGRRGSRAEEERRELRVWMRRKQRERLVEYRRQREEQRQGERKPFLAPDKLKPTSKDISVSKKIKEDKDKVVLLEHHNQRARDACSLIADLLTSPLTRPTNAARTLTLASTSTRPLPDQTAGSTRNSPRGRSRSVGGKGRTDFKSQTGRARSSPGVMPRAQTRPVSSRGQETLSVRLGLHRPASALPKDRLSQITRRGMITTPRGKSGTGPQTPRQPEQRREMSRSPPGRRGGAGGAREPRQTEEREEEVVSPWNPPPEILRLLERTEGHDGTGTSAGREWMDVPDTLSESTGSILSKLDWAAIESIVAAEGAI
ncbi:hypothetical protein DPEC_G00335870 [Dallia pectoralis]|uniref:Uncharacterized protein n=1 Tax=Dallia pectoralis TaxID=75939 RepID=A0ACC2F719_DALPE|nr:hypothetical protein DPEC_G00335870 [Dallia pectoralis]